MKISKGSLIVIILVIFALGAGAGYGLRPMISDTITSDTGGQKSTGKADSYKKLDEAYDLIEKDFYQEPDKTKMEDGMLKGLFAGLEDKYSEYMTKNEYRTYEDSVTGEFEGIGITFQDNKKDEHVIVSTVKESPADKAGLKKRDIILKVDGKKYKDVNKMAMAIKGKKGTKVKLLIKRDGKEKTFEIVRDDIKMDTVESKMMDDKIGYIKITSFGANTDDEYKEAFSNLEEKGMRSLIIDLRDNGGGLIEPAIDIADSILDKCVITYLENRQGKREYFRSDQNHITIPYVILVNGYTASASEILSASIKDKGSGKIVGKRTFGKGVVQNTGEFSDGSGYKLTVMQFFSPDGKTINKKGVMPDYVVKGSKAQMKKAVDLLK